jgi:RHS repeat-associated protein
MVLRYCVMPSYDFSYRTYNRNATAAARPKVELLPLVFLAFVLMLQCRIVIGFYDPSSPALAFTAAIDSIPNRLNFLAPGIVTAWPRQTATAADWLGESRRLFLDGGRVEPDGRRPGRKDHNNYWLTALTTQNGGTYVQNLGSINYDSSGNLTGVTDSLNAGRTQSFRLDRLTRLQFTSGAYGLRTYSYDNNSNRLTWSDGTLTATSHYNAGTNIPGSITYSSGSARTLTFTSSGNLATDNRSLAGGSAVTNTYGGGDRLESAVVGGNTVTFKVNALGQRVSKAFSGSTTHFIYDLSGRLIAEANGSTGATTQEYVYLDGEPLAQIDSSGNIFYIHNDWTGTPQKITNSSRTLVWDYETDPFGVFYAAPTNTTPTKIRFPGQYYDSEDGLNQNWFRDYDPTLPGYIEADPTGFHGGWNPYNYARNNPAKYIDTWGLDATLQCFANAGCAQFPNTYDPLTRLFVAAYNAQYNNSAGSAEYLDPDLVRAMMMQESGNNLAAYYSDPMQVNNPGDWVPEKADYGLPKNACTAPDTNISAGINWLGYKAYRYDANGDATTFLGWPSAVTRYNRPYAQDLDVLTTR